MFKYRAIIPGLILLLVGCFCVRVQRPAIARENGNQKRIVVFCVTASGVPPQALMEPVLVIDGRNYANPVAGDSDQTEISEFGRKYYGPGQKYRLLTGGGDAGSLSIVKAMSDSECFRAGASVKLSGKPVVKLNKNVMALATDSDNLGRRQSSRRAPTRGERTEAIRLAKEAFVAKGSPAAMLPTLEVVNLTATDLDRDGKVELIGTFVLKRTGKDEARHVLFLIAEPLNKRFRATLSNYERFTSRDIMSGGSLDSIGTEGIYTERLVDQLDLDADDTGEVVTITNGFEGVNYKIYKKQSDTWKSVYDFSSYRCAF